MPIHDKLEMMKVRKQALLHAQKMLDPIVDAFEPESYENHDSAPPLGSRSSTTVSQAEQVVTMMINIADWLVEGHNA